MTGHGSGHRPRRQAGAGEPAGIPYVRRRERNTRWVALGLLLTTLGGLASRDLPMSPPAREQLGIVWRGEQVPGVPFFGLFAADGRPRPPFPEHLWPVEVEVEPFTLHGAAWEVLLREVAVT